MRRLFFALAGTAAATLGLLLPVPLPSRAAGPPFRITLLPLDRGEASLLQFPGGSTMLLGAGSAQDSPALLRELKRRGVSRLQCLLVTTYSGEHAGGARALLSAMPVEQVLPNPVVPNTALAQNLRQHLLKLSREKRVRLAQPPSGDTITLYYTPPCQMRFVGPIGPMFQQFAGDPRCSVVLEFSYENIRYLSLGATGARHQESLWKVARPAPTGEVLQLGRAGGPDALLPRLLRPLRTRYAVIPVPRKLAARPAPETLKALRQAGVRVYRTDLSGALTVSSDGTRVTVKGER